MEEVHFKIINNIYPVAESLNQRFKFESTLCSFCKAAAESLQRLFFSCPRSSRFWTDIREWLSLKIKLTPFKVNNIIFFKHDLDPNTSNTVNIKILLGENHLHCSKWRNKNPTFACFINEFTQYFSSLKKSQVKFKICKEMSHTLLF